MFDPKDPVGSWICIGTVLLLVLAAIIGGLRWLWLREHQECPGCHTRSASLKISAFHHEPQGLVEDLYCRSCKKSFTRRNERFAPGKWTGWNQWMEC